MTEERESPTERELIEQLQEEMRRITVPDYLRHLLVSLSSMAFQRLGLTPESVDDRDLAQSRMAIDAFEALVDVLSATFSKEEEPLFRSALHEMRMAFVRASGPEESTPADAYEREAPSAPEGADRGEARRAQPGAEASEVAASDTAEEGADDDEG